MRGDCLRREPSFRGSPLGLSPESISPSIAAAPWIPGSMLAHRPGMTNRNGGNDRRPQPSLFPCFAIFSIRFAITFQ
jgi:hypothetical protein